MAKRAATKGRLRRMGRVGRFTLSGTMGRRRTCTGPVSEAKPLSGVGEEPRSIYGSDYQKVSGKSKTKRNAQ